MLTGHPAREGGAIPIPMGSARLTYTGLSQGDLAQLVQFLKPSMSFPKRTGSSGLLEEDFMVCFLS